MKNVIALTLALTISNTTLATNGGGNKTLGEDEGVSSARVFYEVLERTFTPVTTPQGSVIVVYDIQCMHRLGPWGGISCEGSPIKNGLSLSMQGANVLPLLFIKEFGSKIERTEDEFFEYIFVSKFVCTMKEQGAEDEEAVCEVISD